MLHMCMQCLVQVTSSVARHVLTGALVVQYQRMYDESIKQPEQFWGKIADEFHWDKKVQPWTCLWHCRFVHTCLTAQRQCVSARLLHCSIVRSVNWHASPHHSKVVLISTMHHSKYLSMQWDDKHMSFNFDIRAGPIKIEWFKGGKTNIAYNCLDRNIERGLGQELAFIWEGNEPGLLQHVPVQLCGHLQPHSL